MGFFFWQGEKDDLNAVHAARYEQNVVAFIKVVGEAEKGSGDSHYDGNAETYMNVREAMLTLLSK